MSTILPGQPVATFDDFLADPLVRDELATVIEKAEIRIKGPRERSRNGYKRETYHDLDAADLILNAWREFRP